MGYFLFIAFCSISMLVFGAIVLPWVCNCRSFERLGSLYDDYIAWVKSKLKEKK